MSMLMTLLWIESWKWRPLPHTDWPETWVSFPSFINQPLLTPAGWERKVLCLSIYSVKQPAVVRHGHRSRGGMGRCISKSGETSVQQAAPLFLLKKHSWFSAALCFRCMDSSCVWSYSWTARPSLYNVRHQVIFMNTAAACLSVRLLSFISYKTKDEKERKDFDLSCIVIKTRHLCRARISWKVRHLHVRRTRLGALAYLLMHRFQ